MCYARLIPSSLQLLPCNNHIVSCCPFGSRRYALQITPSPYTSMLLSTIEYYNISAIRLSIRTIGTTNQHLSTLRHETLSHS